MPKTLTASSTRAATDLRRRPGGRDFLAALPWIAPALVLIIGVVLFPAGVMFFNSTREITRGGVDKGEVGLANYQTVLENPNFLPILGRTFIWVIAVVVFTVFISLALANLLNKAFPGRKLVRLAVIIPWAASVVMTTMVIYYGLEPSFGIFNKFMADSGMLQWFHDTGILKTLFGIENFDLTNGVGWTRNASSAFFWSIVVAIFVSLPFTTYTLLAGLQTVPADVLEATRMDGAGPWRTWVSIVLPQLRGALSVAVLINIINVFNSLPILRVMTDGIPGNDADTVMTLIFKYLQDQGKPDVASALSVIAFAIVIVIVAIYVKVVKPLKEV